MSISVARLRVWLLAGAGLLVVVIGAFLGLAHYRATRFIKDLPRKLGVDIQQETTGFTYSQSDGPNGKTIYTIHAAKAVQRTDGKVNLHDVGIVLYGRGQGNEKRADRIYGDEFEYDQKDGVIRAVGVVHIDLQAPAPADAKERGDYAKGVEVKAAGDGKDPLIHVTTSDLVFIQKLATAATDKDVEFTYSGLNGHAHGADFSSDTGNLVLESAVRVNGMKDGQPVALTAARAELDRQKQQVLLNRAVYTVTGGKTGTRVAKGDEITAYLRHNGTVERAIGVGNISLADEDGATVTAAKGEANFNEQNQPQVANLSGGVHYAADDALRQARGEAETGNADFSKEGLLKHVALTGAVHLHERIREGEASGQAASGQGWSERDLVAGALELMMEPADKQVLLRQAKATGDARMTVVNPGLIGAKGEHQGAKTSVVSADLLTADFVMQDARSHLRSMHGVGHTAVQRVSDGGAKGTSSGDTLEAEFRSVRGAVAQMHRSSALGRGRKSEPVGQTGDELTAAVQQGHVVMTNLPAAKTGVTSASAEQKGTADRAVYEGSTEKVTLTGGVKVSQNDSMLWSDRVVMEQLTGDAAAEGSVRVNYFQPKDATAKGSDASEAVHVLASRAELKHDAQRTTFYGGDGRPARLWSGASQVEAPVLEFEQKERRMIAHAAEGDAGMVVHSVFVSATAKASNAAPKNAAGGGGPVRVASHSLTYNDGARQADFGGGVLVEDQNGTMRAEQAVVYLTAADSSKVKVGVAKTAAAGDEFMGGSVDRMVATGQIEIVQPGRKVTGRQVVYTAADGAYVITGAPGALPKIMDDAQGTVTGTTLRFRAGDNSVVISNGLDAVAGQRVRSETRVKQ